MARDLLEPFKGRPVVIRAVTMYYIGLLVDYDPSHLALERASWLAWTGVPWGRFLAEGLDSSAEIEPYPDGVVLVPRGTLVDLSEWRHQLPRVAQ